MEVAGILIFITSRNGENVHDFLTEKGKEESEGVLGKSRLIRSFFASLLIHNVWMVAAFWKPTRALQSKIFTSSELFDKPMDMVEMTWYMILPYLTEKGKEEYEQINAFLEKQS